MNCTEARHALWPPERPRLAGSSVLEARQHVEGCEGCQSYFEQDRRLLDVYDRVGRQQTPRAVRERVFDSLARERARNIGVPDAVTADGAPSANTGGRSGLSSRRRWTLAAVSSAAALFAVATGSALFDRSGAPEEAGLFVEDYLRRAVGEDRITTSDANEVSRFLTRELGLPITPMEVVGLRLAGAEICLLDGRRGAMIRYVEDGREISHYLVPKSGVVQREPAFSSLNASGTSAGVGPAVITWATPQVEQALVGDVAPDRLMEIARSSSLED
jgi:hypothetical protein